MSEVDEGGKLKMGTRNLFANKQRHQQPPKSYHQLRNGNLMFDDDGGPVEQAHVGEVGANGQTYGSGADETSHSNHHPRKVNSNRHHHSHKIQYINPDGSIYLNQSNDALNSSHNIIPNSFISAGNLEQRPTLFHHAQQDYHHNRGHSQPQPEALASSIDEKRHQQQQQQQQQQHHRHHHRLLQHQVHQQLQQIYENAERKPAQTIYALQQNKHDHHNQANDRQQLILKRHTKQQMSQDQHMSMPVVGYNLQPPTEFIEREQQFRSAMMMKSQQNSLMMSALDGQGNGLGDNQQPRSVQQYSQHHEQQYDSLGPPGALKQQQLNEQPNFYVVGTETNGTAGQQRQQLHQVPICSIPEECSSSSGSSGSSNSNSNNNNSNSNEDELLIPEVSLAQSSNRAIIDRRSQLEDLHYATVTAAALLSATANAAAAFAATEKQYDQSREGRGIVPAADDVSGGSCLGKSHSHLNQLNSIYSDTYQDLRRQHRSQQLIQAQHQHHKQQRQHQHQHPIQANRLLKKRLPLQQPNLGRAPVYSMTTDPLINFVNFAEQRAQPAGSVAAALYGPAIVRANQNKPTPIYHIHQVAAAAAAAAANYQQQPNQRKINFSHHLQPPQPPIRRQQLPPFLSNDPMRQQRIIHAVHQRPPSAHKQQQQHQHQLQLTQPQAQALAMLDHRAGKGYVALKADLIGRLLVNNLMASQRPPTSDNLYHQGGQPSSRAFANKLLDGHGLLGRELIYGMAGGEKLFGLSRSNFHVQSAAAVAAAAAAVAPSDSSGHLQVPLVLDRKLKPCGFLERICRIDLTIFWWSLLIISFLFIGALYTLSRYIL